MSLSEYDQDIAEQQHYEDLADAIDYILYNINAGADIIDTEAWIRYEFPELQDEIMEELSFLFE